MRIWLLARRQHVLEIVAKEVSERGAIAIPISCDVANLVDVAQAFGRIGPKVDVLVNAAALPAGSVMATDPRQIVRAIEVNLIGTMLCARESARRMSAGGTILNIGSLCVRVRDNGASLYVATKLGVSGFTDAFRKEMAPRGIRVVLLNPGQIASGMVTETEAQKRAAVEREAMLTPEEVAEVIRYCVELPERVVLTEIELRPRSQSSL